MRMMHLSHVRLTEHTLEPSSSLVPSLESRPRHVIRTELNSLFIPGIWGEGAGVNTPSLNFTVAVACWKVRPLGSCCRGMNNPIVYNNLLWQAGQFY